MAEQTFRSPGFYEQEIELVAGVQQPVGTPGGVIGTSEKGPAFVPVTMAILGDMYPPQQRQLVIGRFLTAGLTGIIFGASAAGIMAVALGWRSFLYVAAATALVAAIGATLLLR